MTNSYRVFTDKHYAYFVTWTIVDWLPLFAEHAYRQIVLDSLSYLRTNKHTQLNAFAIMPPHIHAILWPDDGINYLMSFVISNVLHPGKFQMWLKSRLE